MNFSYIAILSLPLVLAVYGQPGAPPARGFVGVALEDTPQRQGVRIASVAPGSAAEHAGLVAGDLILAINGAPANGAAATGQLIRSLDPGQPARFTVIRGRTRQRQEITLTPGVAPGAAAAATPPPASAAQPATLPANLRFQRLQDPLEHAFTMESPAGWRSVVGLARTGLVQINPYLRALSPDKMTYVLFGDPTFPTFLVPSQMRTAIGMREGSMSSEGVGGRAEIRRYQPGAEFARFYGQIAFAGLCGGLRLVATHDRPDLARKIEEMDRSVVPTLYHAGEAEFTCTHNKQEMSAYSSAVTTITKDQLGMWGVRGFAGFITPREKDGQARGILLHMVESLRWEEAWNQKQSELSRQAGQIIQGRIAQFERQQAAFNAKLNEMDQNFQAMDDIINGTSEYYDASTGTRYKLSNAAPVKWINQGGRIVGTQTDVPPPGYFWKRLPLSGGR